MPGFKYCHTNRWLLKHGDERSSYTARPLRQLLCESPSLRHLKTLKMPYMPSFMDIHRRLGVYSPEYQHQLEQGLLSPDIPGIWVCRELESLHVDFHSHGDGQSQDYYIDFLHSCILEGGLCLLSRLQRLERLRIGYGKVECEAAEEWATRLEEEAVLEAHRLECHNSNTNNNTTTVANLGLLRDVKEMVEKMDTDEFVCLPELDKLAIGDRLERTCEKELRSIFPEPPPPSKRSKLVSRLRRLLRK
ncbi:hypothetical protein BGX23_004197 [Mortierella sp. AD031]|nr:hypothetical protein BGX23_004197 [Mortierella sp. AD031]